MDTLVELEECLGLLDESLDEALRKGTEWALAEAEYYSAKARAWYELEREGMSATAISNVVKGMEEVNDALLRFHKAQVEYENAREARLVYKKRVDVLREQLDREWTRAGMSD